MTPARVPDVITVGSVNLFGEVSDFSNFGPKVDILAPGEDIVSLAPTNGETAVLSGTSMAAPHVTGAVALYLSQNPTATSDDALAWMLSKAGRALMAPPATTDALLWVGPGTGPGR